MAKLCQEPRPPFPCVALVVRQTGLVVLFLYQKPWKCLEFRKGLLQPLPQSAPAHNGSSLLQARRPHRKACLLMNIPRQRQSAARACPEKRARASGS